MVTNRLPDPSAVVVTGAASGIGEACVLRLDQSGFRVFAGVRREEELAAWRYKVSDRFTPIVLDVTDAASITSAVSIVAKAVGETGLAGLINNAGIAASGPLEFLPVAEIRQQFEVNVIGQIAVTQAFLPLLRKGRGRIIYMGSIGGRIAMPFIGPYAASKFAMEAFTDSLRVELRYWNIPVSIIEPGFIATPLWEKSIARADIILGNLPPQADDLYGTAIQTARKNYARVGAWGTPADEVAKTIVHVLTVARPKTRYFVGRGARLLTGFFARLPDRLRDFLVTTFLLKSVKR